MTDQEKENQIHVINDRLRLLTAVLNYSRVFQPMFYRGEKICINQERGALFDMLNFLNDELEAPMVRDYQVPESIEDKISEVKPKLYNIYNL